MNHRAILIIIPNIYITFNFSIIMLIYLKKIILIQLEAYMS